VAPSSWDTLLGIQGFVALRLRVSCTFGRGRIVAAVACMAVFPVALAVPALVALTLIASLSVGRHAYKFTWWHEAEARAVRE
jgi:hypothetical protein